MALENRAKRIPRPEVSIVLPIAEVPAPAYRQTHVDVNGLSERQANNMKRIVEGCRKTGARLENGRAVQTAADVVRYFLERCE